MFKKLAAVTLVGLLITAGLTPANAATVKQGTACTKTGAKTTAGGTKYVCGINPGTTSKKLVWVTTDCISANSEYLNSVKQLATFTSQVANVQKQLTDSIAASNDLLTLLQQQMAAAETADYVVGRDATGVQQSITGRQAAIDRIKELMVETQAKMAKSQADSDAAAISQTDLLAKKATAQISLTQALADKAAAQSELTKVTVAKSVAVTDKANAVAKKMPASVIDPLTKAIDSLTQAIAQRSSVLKSVTNVADQWKKAVDSYQKTSDLAGASISQFKTAVGSYARGLDNNQKAIDRITKIPLDFQTKITAAQAQITSLKQKLTDANTTKATLLVSVKSSTTQAKQLMTLTCKAGL